MSAAIEPLTPEDTLDSLDPQDWEAFRDRAHQLLDTMLDSQRDIAEEPVWRQFPSDLESQLQTPAPREGHGWEHTFQDFERLVAPYPTGNRHPRFWGWVSGTGSPMGLVAEMLAGGLNSISGLFNDSAARVGDQVIRWMLEVMGFPNDGSGVITSGGSVANLVGLTIGRDAHAGWNVPESGVWRGDRLVFYGSSETHASVDKAAMILGLGRSSFRKIPVDENFRIRVDALADAIRSDIREGQKPFAIVGNAGTVNTGAVDDLEALADLAEKHRLWFHIDGAFGAMARLSDDLRPRVKGLERADSVAFDFHKWLYVPYEAGCVLVRDASLHRDSFSVPASYLDPPPRGIGAQPNSSNLRGLQLSRGFKALKVWMCIKDAGFDKLGRIITRNAEQAEYLADLARGDSELELLAPVELNIACFRWAPAFLPEERRNEVNKEILMRLQEEGIAAPSGTTLGGRFALRVAISNQRSRFSDFDLLVRETKRIGREVLRP